MIHQFQLHGYNIVLDFCSGAVHAVDEIAYDIIALYKQHTKDEVVATVFSSIKTQVLQCRKFASATTK